MGIEKEGKHDKIIWRRLGIEKHHLEKINWKRMDIEKEKINWKTQLLKIKIETI